jgi:hypothetical protein
MARDIDYAAAAINRAVLEKFGRTNDLQHLKITAKESTIAVSDNTYAAEGTRHDFMDALRDCTSYPDFWRLLSLQR